MPVSCVLMQKRKVSCRLTDGQQLATILPLDSRVAGFEQGVKNMLVELLEVILLATYCINITNLHISACVLMQTVSGLHYWAQLAHLNISTSSILQLRDQTQPWERVQLQDFGFCRQLKGGWQA